MVDFAEKMQDNKVAEWRDNYVNYVKLKRLLDMAEKAQEKFARENGNLKPGLQAIQEEKEPLIVVTTKTKMYSADVEKNTSYQQEQLQSLSGEVLQKKETFRSFLLEERDKVRDFYTGALKTLENQIGVFVKSAQSTYGTRPASRFSLAQFQKRKSMRTVMAEKFQVNKDQVETRVFDDGESDQEEDEKLHHLVREVASLKRALIDLHRRCQLLNNFSMLNYTAMTRIVKKYNLIFLNDSIEQKEILEDPDHYQGKSSARLTLKMETLYAEWFCNGDLIEAQAHMVHKRDDGLEMDWSQLRFGYRLGICFTLIIWLCWDSVWNLKTMGEASIGGRTAFPVFRACGGLLLVHWFWGCSTYVWRRYRINYIFLFDFNPRTVDEPIFIFNQCVDETLVYLILMLLYYKTATQQMPEWMRPGLYPFLLVLCTAWRLVFPRRTRRPMWAAIAKVVTAPATSPIFFHTYVADVFTSMVKVFLDMLWTLCFILSGDFFLPGSELNEQNDLHLWQSSTWYKRIAVPLLCLFPLWIRLMQCLRRYGDTGKRMPNLANAFKYSMAQTVTLFGAFYPLYLLHNSKDDRNQRFVNMFQAFWLALFVSSSLYSFFWDVYMDWGLGRCEYGFLGPRLMFPSRSYYYGVMFADLVLRFMWVQSLVPPSSGSYFEIPAYLIAINMSLELVRRTIWGFFRLEKEHRANTLGYRSEDFVPLHFTTQHEHNYKKVQARVGRRVLSEVLAVTSIVVIVCMLSVIVAQKSYSDASEL